MIRMTLRSATNNFFDRPAVMKAVGRATRRVFSRFGSHVRTRAKTSIKKRGDEISLPGGPPNSKTGLLRKFIFFAFDERRSSVVIGPVRLNGTKDPGSPERLEYGGTVQGDGRTISVARGDGGSRETITLSGTLKYRPRPFMGPAFRAEQPQLPRLWRDSVR